MPHTAVRLLCLSAAALLCLGLSSCLEPVDAPLKVSAVQPLQTWTMEGSFGGNAVETTGSKDPWEQRFADGGFKLVSGVCAAGSEVWVCDLGISRVQVFDFDGHFLRSYGRGMPIRGTMISDSEFWNDYQQNRRAMGIWQTEGGAPWAADNRELFVAADVYVVPEGFWLADQAKTRLFKPAREPSLIFHGWDGNTRSISNSRLCWPTFVAGEGIMLAASEPQANFVGLYESNFAADGPSRIIGKKSQEISRFVETMATLSSQPRYKEILDRQTNASSAPGELRYPGGIAMRFGKLVVCDRGNKRLQVYEARKDDPFYWSRLIKVILQKGTDGLKRFEEPRDIDIAPDGTMLLLDSGRSEVAVLSPTFDRIGSFGHGEIGDAWAIDLSDDGKRCFVSDRSGNKVWQYVRGE